MDTLIYNIDSRATDMSGFAEFKYNFNTKASGRIRNVAEIKISSIEFPNTSHFFNATHDNISFKIDATTISIASGNYNTDELISAINDSLSAAGYTATASIDKNTGKVTFSNDTTGTWDFSNSTSYKSLGQFLGFTQDTYTGGSVIPDDDLVSENIPNVVGENYFFLKINDYGHIENEGQKYMCKMVMVAPKYEMNFESRERFVTKTYKFQHPKDISLLDISIRDYLGNKVNLNGLHFSFTLEMSIVNNKVLKKYHELSFYSSNLIELILHDHMLEFYSRENENSKIEEEFLTNQVANKLINESHKSNLEIENKYDTKNKEPSEDNFDFNY